MCSEPQNAFLLWLAAHPEALLLDSFPSPGWIPRTSALSWRKTTSPCGLRSRWNKLFLVPISLSGRFTPRNGSIFSHSHQQLQLPPTCFPNLQLQVQSSNSVSILSFLTNFESLHILSVHSKFKTTRTNYPDHRGFFSKVHYLVCSTISS